VAANDPQQPSAGSRRSHFDLDGPALEALLRESRRFKGESLWQDAWRRLKRNRGAWWSLLFLSFFVGTSLLAPLLPLASPMALDPQKEPQPPRWPWESSTRRAEALRPGQRFEFGTVATRSLGSLADNAWRHRTYLDFLVRDGEADLEALASAVSAVAGRRSALHSKPGDEPGTTLVRLAVPLRGSDREHTVYRAEPGDGSATVLELPRGEGPPAYWLWLEVPLDVEQLTSFEARTTPRGFEFVYTTGDEEAADAPHGLRHRRFVVELTGAAAGQLRGLVLGDRAWPLRSGYPGPAEPLGSTLDLGLAAEAGGPRIPLAQLELADLRSIAAVDRDGASRPLGAVHRRVARHEQGRWHEDLGRRVRRALAAEGLAAEGRVAENSAAQNSAVQWVGLSHVDGIWDLNPLDRGLVWLRTAVFGLWQTGPWLGTDNKGRDLLSRIVWGSRISIQVSLVATLCSLLIGVTYGAAAGLLGGRIDNLMMRIVDVLYSVPFIFVVIFLITLINEYRTDLDAYGIGYMTVFYVVVGAIYWLTMARVVRGQVLSLVNQEFIEAARVIGASTPRILFVHLVPNVLSVVIVYLTLTIPAVMLFEAFLSFLGLGVEPPMVSWGLLAVDGSEAISAVMIFWWVVVFPALAMGSTLLALNILGDGLRDALDPKLRGAD
jgi:ABC-type dipeptide/oligopeptide/nickel transport system permease subunit